MRKLLTGSALNLRPTGNSNGTRWSCWGARSLQTNVEFYTALLLHGIGLPTPLFTPVFAAGRVAGWTEHYLEQVASNRLFRPQSTDIGARKGSRIPATERWQDSKEVSDE